MQRGRCMCLRNSLPTWSPQSGHGFLKSGAVACSGRLKGLAMGAWGIGLYSGDFARDLKTTISAVCRVPLDEEPLVDAICQSEWAAATKPADEDHTIFWLVLADQFEKRLIFSQRVHETALAIID